MTANIETLMTELSNLTIIEACELTKRLEEKWGVKAASGMPQMLPAMPQQNAPATSAEATSFTLTLTDAGGEKMKVVQALRKIMPPGEGGLPMALKDANEMTKDLPKVIKSDIDKAEAESIKSQLEAVGAKVEMK